MHNILVQTMLMCSHNWVSEPRDLKRDVAKKLEKLERRTQRAIAELIRKYSSFLVCPFHHSVILMPARDKPVGGVNY